MSDTPTSVFAPSPGDIVTWTPLGCEPRSVVVIKMPDDVHPLTFTVDDSGDMKQARIFDLSPREPVRERRLSSTIVGQPFETPAGFVAGVDHDRPTTEMSPLTRHDMERIVMKPIGKDGLPMTAAEYDDVIARLEALRAKTPSILFDPADPAPAVEQIRKRLGLKMPATEACEKLLETLCGPSRIAYDPETPERMGRALQDLLVGYAEDPKVLLKTFPVEGDHGMVIVRDIPFASLCEHHVLPFSGTVSVAYVPSDRIVGLSKIPRLVRAMSRRLQVQERIGVDVADALMQHVGARGVLVVIKGRHSCMQLRGAESPGEMVTSCVRGVFETEASARAEALALIR